MRRMLPGLPFPDVDFPMLGGGTFKELKAPEAFRVLTVYRGLHCPRCRAHLEDLAGSSVAFASSDCDVVAVSMNDEGLAKETQSSWTVADIHFGFGLEQEAADRLNLYLSESIREGEPEIFCEPAIFIIAADGIFYGGVWTTFPFLRPSAAEILELVDRALQGYPPRGNHS